MSRRRFLTAKLPATFARGSRWIACGVLALAVSQCGSPIDVVGGVYTIKWTFINQGPGFAEFIYYTDETPRQETGSVPQGGTVGGITVAEILAPTTTSLVVTVPPTDDHRGAGTFQDVPVSPDETTNVTVIWNGIDLTVSFTPPCPPAAPGFFEPAAACQAPTTWKLDGITGNSSGMWSDQTGTGTGTLSFNVPQEVQPGQTYQVSATFSGSFTAVPAWSGIRKNISVGVCDRLSQSFCGQGTLTSALQLERAELVASGAVTASGSWSITASYPATFTIEAAGNIEVPGATLKLVATYSKQP